MFSVGLRWFLGGLISGVICYIPYDIYRTKITGISMLSLFLENERLVSEIEAKSKKDAQTIIANLDPTLVLQELETQEKIQNIFDNTS
jgi:hypothetical protein